MTINKIEAIYQKHIKKLLPNERLKLLELITNDLTDLDNKSEQVTIKQRDWVEIRGKAPKSYLGEDAQNWVSRTRKESDEQREKQSIHKS